MHVSAKNDIDGFGFTLGLQGDLVNYNVLDEELRWLFRIGVMHFRHPWF